MTFFLEDDEELESIRQSYLKGELLTGELKARCIKELQTFVGAFQERKKAVTDEVVKSYMTPKPLEWNQGKGLKKETASVVAEVTQKIKDAVVG